MKTVLLTVSILVAAVIPHVAVRAQQDETAELLRSFSLPKHINLFQSAMWTVTHDYTDYKHMDEVVKEALSFFEAAAKHQQGETGSLRDLGGVPGFKAKLAKWLKDDDQAIRAFAAVLIGITGDKKLAPELLALIETRKPKADELLIYDRGRAAMAIGLLGANEYKGKIARLLKSENGYDRSGAIFALSSFGATEFAPEIAALLDFRGGVLDDDASAIHFLIDTGTAKDYKRKLAKAVSSKYQSEVAIAAMYALAAIDAKEHAPDIAKQLADKFRRGDAAKALALLGAKQFTKQIARLLADESLLVRSSASLALGVLEAREYSRQVAALLRDKEGSVAPHAATSLFMMGAAKYYPLAYPFLEKSPVQEAYASDSEFSPLVEKKVQIVRQRLKANLDAFAKTRTTK
jgi:HEAT repeat protein